jgi:cyanophycinase
MHTILIRVVLCCMTCHVLAFCADAPQEAPNVPGFLIIHAGKSLSEKDTQALVKLAAADGKGKIVYVTTQNDAEAQETKAGLDALKKNGAAPVFVAHVTRETINDSAVLAHLKEATGVWLDDATRDVMDSIFAGTAVEAELFALQKRSGVIVASPNWMPKFVPGAVVAIQHAGDAGHADLLKRVGSKPGSVGYIFNDDASLFLHERSLYVVNGNVSVCMAASANRPVRDELLTEGSQADLVALTRATRERTRTAFPPAKFDPIELEGGTLVIDGGGIPKEALTRFIQAAGGPDALILAVPTAQSDDPPLNPGEAKMLRAAGAKNVKTFHLATHADAFDESKIKIINEAKGIWFCGGRQWRYVDAYLDTPAEQLMHALLKRGGVIGGSSAGATIQGDYLVRGNPLGNVQMMAEGYERGLGFLRGVAIDQHFIFRNRFADMTALKKAFPQVLGLGIDQGAALVVTGHVMEVIGNKSVCVYDKKEPPANGNPDYVTLQPGERYDLKTLSKIDSGALPVKP